MNYPHLGSKVRSFIISTVKIKNRIRFGCTLDSFWRDRSGVFAIVFALLLIPIVAAGAAAVDVARLLYYRSLLKDSADMAVLAAVSEKSRARSVGEGWFTQTHPQAREDIDNFFRRNLADAPANSIELVSVGIAAHGGPPPSGMRYAFTASLTYVARVKTLFGGILGIDAVTFNGASKASATTPQAAHVVFLVDDSFLMGYGATPADQARMNASGAPGEEVYAHWSTLEDNIDEIRSLGVTLKLDVVQRVMGDMLDAFKNESLRTGIPFYVEAFGGSYDWKGADRPNYTSSPILNSGGPGSGTKRWDFREMSNPQKRKTIISLTPDIDNARAAIQEYFGDRNNTLNKFDQPRVLIAEYSNSGFHRPGMPNFENEVFVVITTNVQACTSFCMTSPAYSPAQYDGSNKFCTFNSLNLAFCVGPLSLFENYKMLRDDRTQRKSLVILDTSKYSELLGASAESRYHGIRDWISDYRLSLREMASPGLYYEIDPDFEIQPMMKSIFEKYKGVQPLPPLLVQ